MKLSLIIVNWNTRDLLKQAITSIFEQTKNIEFEVLVVDNNSADDSVAMVRREFSPARIIENAENFGFARANNIGLENSPGEYLMLLNSDIIILDGALNKLVAYLDNHPEAALVGPRLLNKDGSFQHACRRNLPDPVNSFYHLFGLTKLFKNSEKINRYKKYNLDPEVSGETEALSGAAMMFRRKIYDQIGGLDERFFMYGEDLDFCKRVLDAGGQIHYVSAAQITHLGGESSHKRRFQSLKNFYEAMWIYYRKHFYEKSNFLLNGLVWVGIKVRFFIAVVVNLFK